MSAQSDISTIEGIVNGLDTNRVARESYTEEAFNANDVNGVAAFNVANAQNIPLATATDLNETVLNKGLQTQGASLPRPAINHFFGRVSYNLNKLVQYVKVFVGVVKAALAHNNNEYDPSALYAQGDCCYTLTFEDSRYAVKTYVRTSASPATIQGTVPTNTDHWTQAYTNQAVNALKLNGIEAARYQYYDLVIDSNAKLATWAASGTYEKVLIKAGTWTHASGGIDLTARGTKLVAGEPGSKLVFTSAEKGLYYTTLPTTKDYRMNGVTVECSGGSYVYGFHSCTNLTNCTGTGGGHGFYGCTNLTNCTGTGYGYETGYGYGFESCTNLTNCTGTGTGGASAGFYGDGYGFESCTNLTNSTGHGFGSGSGYGYGFSGCRKCQQNTATGTTTKYYASYADAGTSYHCADTPNGGFNS